MLTVTQTKSVADQILALLKNASGKPVRRGQILGAIARGQGFETYEAFLATSRAAAAPAGTQHPHFLATGADNEILPGERGKAELILADPSLHEVIYEPNDADSYFLVKSTGQVVMVCEGTTESVQCCRVYAYPRDSDALHARLSSEIPFETFEQFFGRPVALRYAEFHCDGMTRVSIPPLDPSVATACRAARPDEPLVEWFAYGPRCGAHRFLAPDIRAVGDDIQDAIDIFGDVFDIDTAKVTDILPVRLAGDRFVP